MSKNRKKNTPRPRGGGVPGGRSFPWSISIAVLIIAGLVSVIAYNMVPKAIERTEAQKYAPSADNPDPSLSIEGVTEIEYAAGNHIQAPQRVAYDQTPPLGGAHDQYWATCTGIVYPEPIRTENAVHSLEHGAVWIAYNPDSLNPSDVDALTSQVNGKPYSLMSPFPGIDSPVSIQSWGHQLKVDSVDDPRIAKFITALKQNPNTHPEAGASCATVPEDSTRTLLSPSTHLRQALTRFPQRRSSQPLVFPQQRPHLRRRSRGVAKMVEHEAVSIQSESVSDSSGKRHATPAAVLVVGIVIALLIGIIIGLWAKGRIENTSQGVPAVGAVEVGFAQDMSVHHGQAVEMSSLALVNTADPAIRTLAYDVVTTQQSQIGMMQGWLSIWDRPARSTGEYMEWMPSTSSAMNHSMPGMSTGQSDSGVTESVAMPGMASPAELAELRTLTGPAFEIRYLQLLLRHHQGGIPMAQYAADNADLPVVTNLARQIAATQQAESTALRELLAVRGAQPIPMN